MSTKREPLLSDSSLKDAEETIEVSSVPVDKLYRFREIYEASRAKDAELIQMLVDAMYSLRKSVRMAPYNTLLGFDNALDAATAQGFKPSEP